MFVPIDLPIELEVKLQILADKADLTLNDYLSQVLPELIERRESLSLRPVKSLTLRPVGEPVRSDLLPVPVQFYNTSQD